MEAVTKCRSTVKVAWKWKCVLLSIVVGILGAAGAVVGTLWLWTEEPEDDGVPPEFEGLTCFDISRNVDAYWKCMVRGYDLILEGKLPRPLPPEELLNGSVKGYEILRRVKRKGRSRRVRRSSSGPYKPIWTNYTLHFNPILLDAYTNEYKDRGTHDYWRSQKADHSEELYFNDKNDLYQQPPPWSYKGFFSPKDWHKLNLKKFMQPIDHELSLTEAMFRDLGTEALFNVSSEFRGRDGSGGVANAMEASKLYFWSPKMVQVAFHNETSYDSIVATRDVWPPKYILEYLRNTHNKDKRFMKELDEIYFSKTRPKVVEEVPDMTLVAHNPKKGYYSGLRFLLPPPVKDKTVRQFMEDGNLLKSFHRPSQNYIDFYKLNRYAEDLIKAWKVYGEQGDEYREMNKVAQWFGEEHAKNPQRTGGVYTNKDVQYTEGAVKGVLNESYISETLLKNLRERVMEQREGPKLREYYSLPLLPEPYRMCRHSEPSPINIVTQRALTSSIQPYFYPLNFCKRYPVSFRFRDDGTNVLIARFEGAGLYANDGVGIKGGIIKGTTMFLDEIHIHVGETPTTGSEHKINGNGYAMEFQFIFTITGSDRTQPYHYVLARQIGDLFQYRENLVLIIAKVVEVKPAAEIKVPLLFEPLAQAASVFRMQQHNRTNKKFRGYTTEEPVWALSDFLPRGEPFYTYRGSLTTPPCIPYIFWSVYTKPLQMTPEQFQQLQMWPTPGTDDTGFLAGNVRRMEDMYVEDEHEPDLTQEEIAKRREKRENRVVLESSPLMTISEEDYFYDYYLGTSSTLHPQHLLSFFALLVSLYNLFSH